MKERILEVEQLSFAYDDRTAALKQVSLVINKNEKIAVLGANGAGKSTFFLHLNGVRQPDSGAIYLHGERIQKKHSSSLRKCVGIVFQDPDSQIIASTVTAEVAFGPLNMRLPRNEVEQRTKRALTQMKLLEFADRPPHYLSGGEKKRVSIADILAMEPEIIIFDEPTASLDPMHMELLEEILEELAAAGTTILLSTHDVDFAYRFADRVLVFHDGALAADGLPVEIFQDAKLLLQTHLKQPMIMQMYELLKQQHLIGHVWTETNHPKTIADLEALIHQRKGERI